MSHAVRGCHILSKTTLWLGALCLRGHLARTQAHGYRYRYSYCTRGGRPYMREW